MWWLINYIIGFIFFVVIAYRFRRDVTWFNTTWFDVDGEFFPLFVWFFAIVWPLSLLSILLVEIIGFMHKQLMKL